MGPADRGAMEQAVEGIAAAREVRRGDRPRVGPRDARRQARGGGGEGAGRAGGRARRPRWRTKLRREGSAPRGARGSRRKPRKEKSAVEEVLTSTTARQFGRTAVREIVRGMFGTGPPMSRR